MPTPDLDHPGYELALRIQRTQGRELLRRHGAHALSVEWAPTGAGDEVEPVLVFCVDPDAPAGEPVPSAIAVPGPDGASGQVATRVRRDPPAALE